MRWLFVALLALTLQAGDTFRVRVTRIYDGRTVAVRDFVGREAIVVLDDIDVPTRFERNAARSRESLRQLVKYRIVMVEPHGYDDGRILARVKVGETDVAEEQVKRGYASWSQN